MKKDILQIILNPENPEVVTMKMYYTGLYAREIIEVSLFDRQVQSWVSGCTPVFSEAISVLWHPQCD